MRESLPWQQPELPLSSCQPLLTSCGTSTVTHESSVLYLVNSVCVCVQAAAAAGQSHARRWGHRRPRQRLQPQRLLLFHGGWVPRCRPEGSASPSHDLSMTFPLWPFSARRHAPGLRQHAHEHVGGPGRSHHQRGLRPGTLPHARLPGAGQARRPAPPQPPSVTADTNLTTRVQKLLYSD